MKRALLVLLAAAGIALLPLSGQAALLHFSADLDGPGENPPNPSPGIGHASVTIDTVTHIMHVSAVFSGLLSPTTAAHIHCCVDAPGNVSVATPAGPTFAIDLGVTAGDLDQMLDLSLASSFRAGFIAGPGGGSIAGAEAALIDGLYAGRAYFNVHTSASPGGEIRGFLVPEPASMSLVALGLAGAWLARRRRR